MARTIAIIQSSYIPWKGYFDAIAAADVFVLYDEVQFTKQDWRSRNRIKTQQGLQWLSIPIRRDTLDKRVCDTVAADDRWRMKHWKSIEQAYRKAPSFEQYADPVKGLYLDSQERRLSQINRTFIEAICEVLSITTPLVWSSDVPRSSEGRIERLVEIVRHFDGTRYLSGPAARNYMTGDEFASAGIELEWLRYDYPPYPQLHGEFEHAVSVLDLLFNVGSEAHRYMLSTTLR